MGYELHERDNYRSPIPFLFNNYIREYDISKANINILFAEGVISKELYDELYNAPRDVRQYVIGNMQKDEQVNAKLMGGFAKYRQLFYQSNGLTEYDLLAVRKDAIFVINKLPKYTKFGNVEFLCKNTYTSYMSFLNKKVELYYTSSKLNNGVDKIDVKGIGDNALQYHKEYFLDFLYYIFEMIENDGVSNLINGFKCFYDDYINRRLSVGYYRTFDSFSSFLIDINNPLRPNVGYLIDSEYLAQQYIQDINISYNLNILSELFKCISNISFYK